MIIELDNEDFSWLVLVLGYAAGAASKDGDRLMRDRILHLANAVNKDNLNWTPILVPKRPETPVAG